MNKFKKYCPNVWVAECDDEYEREEIITKIQNDINKFYKSYDSIGEDERELLSEIFDDVEKLRTEKFHRISSAHEARRRRGRRRGRLRWNGRK